MKNTSTLICDHPIDKKAALSAIEEALQKAKATVLSKREINGGLGVKFDCCLGNKFGIILYLKQGKPSKLVFENTPLDVKNYLKPNFCAGTPPETTHQKPILISFSIRGIDENTSNKILEELLRVIPNNEVSDIPNKSKKIIFLRNNDKFTLTIYPNGTILLQGLSTPLFDEIRSIINTFKPLTDIENVLIYTQVDKQVAVQDAVNCSPEVLNDLQVKAANRISKEAFDFLYLNNQQELCSAIAILELIKQHDLKIPLYNSILYPFSKVFEGFLIKLLIEEKKFVAMEQYKDNPDILEIGNALRKNKLEKYIKDNRRDGFILGKLTAIWESLRCQELHSDPIKNPDIINLKDIHQVENKIGEISSTIMDAHRILIVNGYTEDEMLKNRESITKIQPDVTMKEIPVFTSRIGTDESGKGDYFGPLVIAGVFLDSSTEKLLEAIGVKDSKENSDSKNQELAIRIREIIDQKALCIVCIGPEKYNELYSKIGNLNKLLAWGHSRVIENILAGVNCENVIADQFGDEAFINQALMDKGRTVNLLQTPKAERDLAVAAASILARDKYLSMLRRLSKDAGVTLLKGASSQVEDVARKMKARHGIKELSKYAKLHFKTTSKI